MRIFQKTRLKDTNMFRTEVGCWYFIHELRQMGTKWVTAPGKRKNITGLQDLAEKTSTWVNHFYTNKAW